MTPCPTCGEERNALRARIAEQTLQTAETARYVEREIVYCLRRYVEIPDEEIGIRPIWQTIEMRFAALRARVAELESDVRNQTDSMLIQQKSVAALERVAKAAEEMVSSEICMKLIHDCKENNCLICKVCRALAALTEVRSGGIPLT